MREVGADLIGARKFVPPRQEKVLVSELLDELETKLQAAQEGQSAVSKPFESGACDVRRLAGGATDH